MFADMNDAIRTPNSRYPHRGQPAGRTSGSRTHRCRAARGIEITVTIDERAFEGTGVFLLGAVLDRFFAEYSAFNHFTQTVIRSVERGEIMRWPPRIGTRRAL